MASSPIAIVTGSTGFLGRHLVARLLLEGWAVHGVARKPDPTASIPTHGWESVLGGTVLRDLQPEAVFHCAAFIPPRQEDSSFAAECLEANALLTLRLAEAAARVGSPRFLHCSSGQIYGFQTRPADESAPPQTARRACFYLSSKLLSELYVERCHVSLGLPSVIFRIGSLYGPGMPERSVVARFLATARQRRPLPLVNGGTEQFDFVTVEDVATLLVCSARLTVTGVFNAGSGEATTARSLAEQINAVTHNPAGLDPDGIPPAAPSGGFAPLCMNRTRSTFGLRPTPLAEGLERLCSGSSC